MRIGEIGICENIIFKKIYVVVIVRWATVELGSGGLLSVLALRGCRRRFSRIDPSAVGAGGRRDFYHWLGRIVFSHGAAPFQRNAGHLAMEENFF